MNLSEIQKKLKAVKGEKNEFGGYNYRSAEGILEAVKPLLGEDSLILSDEMVEVGGRVYVKATAILYGAEREPIAQATAYAREPLSRKGMDESQVTGAASSYARKYALSGLFAIDNNKDADDLDNRFLVRDALNACTSIAELAEAWERLSPAEKQEWATLKSQLKSKLPETK